MKLFKSIGGFDASKRVSEQAKSVDKSIQNVYATGEWYESGRRLLGECSESGRRVL